MTNRKKTTKIVVIQTLWIINKILKSLFH